MTALVIENALSELGLVTVRLLLTKQNGDGGTYKTSRRIMVHIGT